MSMVRNQQTSGVYNPIRIIAVACAVTVGVLVWLGWSIYDSDRVASLANERLYELKSCGVAFSISMRC